MSGAHLELRQSQSLAMTQQLRQAIAILQMTAQEVQAVVAEEMEKNPLLTTDAPTTDTPDTTEAEATGNQLDVGEGSERLDTTSDDIWGEPTDYASRFETSNAHTTDDSWMEQISERPLTLREHVYQQITLTIAAGKDQQLALYMLDLLDDQGFLREDDAIIAQQLNSDTAAITAMRIQLQACEPTGLFARDLTDCLRLQLDEQDHLDPAMCILLDNLALLTTNETKKLAKLCHVEEEELGRMLQLIRCLNPNPAANFLHEPVQLLIPDVYIRRAMGSDAKSHTKNDAKNISESPAPLAWQVELNQDALPKLLIHQEYKTTLETTTDSAGQQASKQQKEQQSYLKDQMRHANWLIRALDQRASSILKVSTEILRWQEGFFLHGIHHLKPMRLQDIAEATGLHESTVSRVVTGKYMSTPRGVFEFRYFFSVSLNTELGGNVSVRSVQEFIRKMVQEETADTVLSDDTIAEKLGDRGIEVARRTVVKYRQKLGIPSSVERRRQKRG